MAGSYPDVPGPRMAYDRDGTVGLRFYNNTGFTNPPTHVMPAAQMQKLNNEILDTGGAVGVDDMDHDPSWPEFQCGGVALVFPQLRDMAGWEIAMSAPSFYVAGFEWSANTTNGQDGTWSAGPSIVGEAYTGTAKMRNDIATWTQTGVKGIRWAWCSGGSRQFTLYLHLYGTIAAGQTPNRLRIWHPTLNQEVDGPYFDWGDTPRSSAAVRDFRVKNNSASQTAEAVVVSMEALTELSPPLVSQHEFSDDAGASYAASLAIGDLAPGALSDVLRLRRSLSAGAALGLAWQRIVAVAGTWS